ncbi:MAG: M50 family metallopeptidase, partial [Pyrinomonadaceae bacterium]
MKFNVAPDARPQVKTLLIATLLSLALWFIPYAEYLVYPFRLFVTFIHEGGHALAAVITGGAVASLTVSPDTSGEVFSASSGPLAALIVSSAGYVGATLFGALLLILIRQAFQARIVLAGTAVYIAALTVIFGLFLPILNFTTANVTFFSVMFTVATGSLIAASLLLVARYASPKIATSFLSFLAVQCVLNALFDLKTVFVMSSPFAGAHVQTDAVNMYNATGVPSLFWVMAWIGISIV